MAKTITLADFKVTAGYKPDGWTHERIVDGYLQVYWPAAMCGEDGWWWAIGTLDGLWLAGGWALGSVRDRNIDIARALVAQAQAEVAA